MERKKIVIVGAGVAGVNAATKLVDNGHPGELITIIDMGKDPYRREYSEVMEGFLGAGGWSDGKLTYHTSIGGQLSKYCGEEKAMSLFDEVIANFKRFHPKPEEVQCSDPQAESGIDFGKQLAEEYNLPTEPKSVQIGVRFEAPQEHFQKLIDVSYDFKLYRKFEDKGVSLRSFCTNNNAAYVAAEHTYGDVSYNGHARKDEKYRNDMTNFGILMEIKDIDKPFDWSREAVKKLQKNGVGTFYSPNHQRTPSTTSEGNYVGCEVVDSIQPLYEAIGDYALYIENFIEDMKKIFPTLGNDWGIYMPEVKYLSPEPLVNYDDLSLTKYPNVVEGVL